MNAAPTMRLLDAFADLAPALLCGSTALLAAGCLAAWCARRPIQRQRIGETAMLAVAAWLALAVVPLPRWARTDKGARQEIADVPGLAPVALPVDAPRAVAKSPIPASADPPPAPSPGVAPEFIGTHETAAELPMTEAAAAVAPSASPATTSPAPSPAPDAASDDVAAQSPDWRQLAAAGYLFGAAAAASWLLLGRALLMRLMRQSTPAPAWLAKLFAQVHGGEPAARLVVSRRCTRPMSFGVWRPTIVLPESLCQPRHASRLAHILRHELAHVNQGDARGRLLFNALFPALYAHPLYWQLRLRARLACELIADDLAARHSSPRDYARELLTLAKADERRCLPWLSTLGIWSSPTQFYRRMSQLLERPTPLATCCTRRWQVGCAMACLLAVMFAASQWGARASWSADVGTGAAPAPGDGRPRFSRESAALADDSVDVSLPRKSPGILSLIDACLDAEQALELARVRQNAIAQVTAQRKLDLARLAVETARDQALQSAAHWQTAANEPAVAPGEAILRREASRRAAARARMLQLVLSDHSEHN